MAARRSRTVALLLGCWLSVATAEIQDFSILLPATDMYVHYADGFLRGGHSSIDLTDLTFTAVDPSSEPMHDDTVITDDGDDMVFDGGGSMRRLDGGIDINGESVIDIVSFMLPAKCANSRSGCDWTELGVGAMASNDTLRWCCTNDAIDLGLCEGGEEEYGRLILTKDFAGEQRYVAVPSSGPMTKKLKNNMFEFQQTGHYVVVFANCNNQGREVMVSGEAVWKSSHGYLPGELFSFMYFFTFLTGVYVVLFLWYFCLMRIYKESRIPIEKWILMAIGLGLMELTFRTADYWDWNTNGTRHEWLSYVGVLVGVLKHGISRCLIVMVSLGWGVVRDSLGNAMIRIVILGVIYVAVAGVRDLMILFAVEDMQTLSYESEVELFNVATILTFVVAAVDVVFIMWILDALNGTMMYLENMNQNRKLARYLRLRTLFLFSILFATVWAVFSLVNTYDEDGIVREEHEWVVEAAKEVNYLFVLIGVAILWRPNPSAKEYAYVMELPAMSGEDGETELELSGVVPSAADDDEEEPTYTNGYSDGSNGNHHDDRFKIDDGELS